MPRPPALALSVAGPTNPTEHIRQGVGIAYFLNSEQVRCHLVDGRRERVGLRVELSCFSEPLCPPGAHRFSTFHVAIRTIRPAWHDQIKPLVRSPQPTAHTFMDSQIWPTVHNRLRR